MAQSTYDSSDAGRLESKVGTTPYQRMVVAAAALIQTPPELPKVSDVARMTGVAPDLAVEMFATDAALCTAVAEDVIARLGAFVNLRVAAAPLDDPAQQMRSMMLGYHDWATAEPVGARMLVDHRLPQPCREVCTRYVTALIDLTRAILRRADAMGRLRSPMTVDSAELLGRSVLVGAGRIRFGDEGDYLRDRACDAMHADIETALNLYCDLIFQA